MLAYTGDTATERHFDLPDIFGLPPAEAMAKLRHMEATRSGTEWFEKKETLSLDFPSLPYYKDGEVKLTQTLAIGAYLADKHGLVPSTLSAAEFGRALMLVKVAREWFKQFQGMVTKPKEVFDEMFHEYRCQTLPNNLKRLEAYLTNVGERQQRFLLKGDKPSLADFVMFDYVDLMAHVDEYEVMSLYAKVMAYHERIAQLPAVRKLAEMQPRAFWPAFPKGVMWGSE